MENKFYGLNFAHIPRETVPFDYNDLKDRDMLENTQGTQLTYLEKDKVYRLITNDPTIYLSEDGLYKNWKKIGEDL